MIILNFFLLSNLYFMTEIYSFGVGFNKLLIGGSEKWNKFHNKGEGVLNKIDFFFSYKNWNKEVSYRAY